MPVGSAVDAAAAAPVLDAAQLAEAFALFSRASEELSTAYAALQAQVGQLSERLSVLMGALPAGVLVVDRAGTVVQANRAADGLFGGGLAGMAWAALAARLEDSGTPGEFVLRRDPATVDGDARRLALSESELDSGAERILLVHDVTDTHRMRLTAERNERLAAMGEMVAGLAHQLRTPLAAALLYTGNLRQPELDPAQRAMVADRALERLRYLERLIRDMLLFARGDSAGRQRFAVCELLAELAHTLEPVARARQVAFAADCGCGEAELVGDRKALGGALTNLLENGIQACEAGGTLRPTPASAHPRCASRCATAAAASPPSCRNASSNPSSPPAPKAPGWAWPSPAASPAPTAATSPCAPRPGRARNSPWSCRWRRRPVRARSMVWEMVFGPGWVPTSTKRTRH